MLQWLLDISWIRADKLRVEEPHSSIAFLAISPNSLAFLLLSSPSSPSSISFSKASLMPSFLTKTPILSSSPHFTGTSTPSLTPIPSTSTTSFSLQNCSAKSGHVAIGSPADIPSRVEFHPQWVRNPPTAWWARMSTCGAHPRTTRAFSLLRSSKALLAIQADLCHLIGVEACQASHANVHHRSWAVAVQPFQTVLDGGPGSSLRFVIYRAGNLGFTEFNPDGEIRDEETGEATGSVENEAGDVEAEGDLRRPGQPHVGDEASGGRLNLFHRRLGFVAEHVDGGEEVGGESGVEAGGVEWGGEDGDGESGAAGEELGYVHHWDHVAWGH
nr:hypothetical protein BHM03_00062011 [Ipomoea batatas]